MLALKSSSRGSPEYSTAQAWLHFSFQDSSATRPTNRSLFFSMLSTPSNGFSNRMVILLPSTNQNAVRLTSRNQQRNNVDTTGTQRRLKVAVAATLFH